MSTVSNLTRVSYWQRPHLHDALLRSIGGMSIAGSRLARIHKHPAGFPPGQSLGSWSDFAAYLEGLVDEVMMAAIKSSKPTTALLVVDGKQRRFTMDSDAIDQLAGKLDQHARMAYLIGYESAD